MIDSACVWKASSVPEKYLRGFKYCKSRGTEGWEHRCNLSWRVAFFGSAPPPPPFRHFSSASAANETIQTDLTFRANAFGRELMWGVGEGTRVFIHVNILKQYVAKLKPIRWICWIIDNQRSGLETQGKVLMLLTAHPWYGLICFTLEPCNFTLKYISGFWIYIFWTRIAMSMQLSIFKTSFGYNKAKNRRLILAFFFTTELSPSMLLKRVIKTFNGDFCLVYPPEKLEK